MSDKQPDWSPATLKETVRAYVGSGYNQDAPPFAQFCHAASKIIQKRRTISPKTLTVAPAVFVMAAVPEIAGLCTDVQPMFDRGAAELAGRVWFGAHRLAKGVGIDLPKGTDQQRFTFVTESLRVGTAPTIYYDASCDETVMRIYPKGLEHPDDYDESSLDTAKLTLKNLKNILDALHCQLLKTPTASEAARDLWENTDKCIPVRESEKGIQKILHGALVGTLLFGPVVVKQEGTSAMGRYDFRLDEQDPLDSSKWTHLAILELKVVKSFTSTGTEISDSTNRRKVTEGVDQANEYRNDHSCRMAALCCFDMRRQPKADEAVAHEETRAIEIDVVLWAWPIYSTPKRARIAQAEQC